MTNSERNGLFEYCTAMAETTCDYPEFNPGYRHAILTLANDYFKQLTSTDPETIALCMDCFIDHGFFDLERNVPHYLSRQFKLWQLFCQTSFMADWFGADIAEQWFDEQAAKIDFIDDPASDHWFWSERDRLHLTHAYNF